MHTLDIPPVDPSLFAGQLWRLPKVLEYVPLGKSTLYTLIKQGRFPAPVSIGNHSVVWPAEAVIAFRNTLITQGWKPNTAHVENATAKAAEARAAKKAKQAELVGE